MIAMRQGCPYAHEAIDVSRRYGQGRGDMHMVKGSKPRYSAVVTRTPCCTSHWQQCLESLFKGIDKVGVTG